ncbi:vacuolar segregation subunit 7-domain-containing protein [Dipodascopsis uninucleata]
MNESSSGQTNSKSMKISTSGGLSSSYSNNERGFSDLSADESSAVSLQDAHQDSQREPHAVQRYGSIQKSAGKLPAQARRIDSSYTPINVNPLDASSDEDRSNGIKSSGKVGGNDGRNITSEQQQAHDSDDYKSEEQRPASVRRLFTAPSAVGSIKKTTQETAKSSGTHTLNASSGNNAMTVETETVITVPSVAVAPAVQGGSIKSSKNTHSKVSYKQKKKRSKPISTLQGTSKADIFAAKIASAVDDHDSSDSDETFVYESNPRDPSTNDRLRVSRSPSLTSLSTARSGKIGDVSDAGGNYYRSGSTASHKHSRKHHNTPRSINNMYATSKGHTIPSSLIGNSLGSSSNTGLIGSGHDNFIDDDDVATAADGEYDVDYEYEDESAPLNGQTGLRRRRRRKLIRQQQVKRIRRSIWVICLVVLALLLGFSLGVVYVTK